VSVQALTDARAELARRVPDAAEREIVKEWCDRYRLGFGDFDYDDAAIMRLATRLWCEGRINDYGGKASPPYAPRGCPA
jgi:hypothetical protein